jgi:hypothetical protein
MRVGVTLLLVGQVGINFSSFCEPASRFTSAIERGNMEEGKIATVAQFGATERSPSMYIRMRATLSNTCWGRLINFSSFGEPASRFTSAIERSGIWKKVR